MTIDKKMGLSKDVWSLSRSDAIEVLHDTPPGDIVRRIHEECEFGEGTQSAADWIGEIWAILQALHKDEIECKNGK